MPTDCGRARAPCPARAPPVSHKARPWARACATPAPRLLAAEVVLADRAGRRSARRIGADRLDLDATAHHATAHCGRKAKHRSLPLLQGWKIELSPLVAVAHEAH